MDSHEHIQLTHQNRAYVLVKYHLHAVNEIGAHWQVTLRLRAPPQPGHGVQSLATQPCVAHAPVLHGCSSGSRSMSSHRDALEANVPPALMQVALRRAVPPPQAASQAPHAEY